MDKSAILDFSGNHFDLTAMNTDSNGLQPAQWIVVPGGKRELKDWGPPAISRSNPAFARYLGEGTVSEASGARRLWQLHLADRIAFISGYDYSGIHRPSTSAGIWATRSWRLTAA